MTVVAETKLNASVTTENLMGISVDRADRNVIGCGSTAFYEYMVLTFRQGGYLGFGTAHAPSSQSGGYGCHFWFGNYQPPGGSSRYLWKKAISGSGDNHRFSLYCPFTSDPNSPNKGRIWDWKVDNAVIKRIDLGQQLDASHGAWSVQNNDNRKYGPVRWKALTLLARNNEGSFLWKKLSSYGKNVHTPAPAAPGCSIWCPSSNSVIFGMNQPRNAQGTCTGVAC